MFRINGFDNVTNGIEFFFKATRDSDNSLICNFSVEERGIFFYRKGSKILTTKESPSARNSYDGFISMEDLANLFAALAKAGLAYYNSEEESTLEISRKGKKVLIEKLK